MSKAKLVKAIAKWTKKAARLLIGGLSNPGKMPCFSWGIPAKYCKVGQELAKVPGSICSVCYALKNNYVFPVVKAALERRYKVLMRALRNEKFRAQFIDAFVFLLQDEKYFRWHDSGDLQGHEHLALICDIAERLPSTKFWLPTREYQLVNTYLGVVPANLLIRRSGHMIDGAPPAGEGLTSTAHTVAGQAKYGFECLSYTRADKAKKIGPNCGPCRACWDVRVKNVSYLEH